MDIEVLRRLGWSEPLIDAVRSAAAALPSSPDLPMSEHDEPPFVDMSSTAIEPDTFPPVGSSGIRVSSETASASSRSSQFIANASEDERVDQSYPASLRQTATAPQSSRQYSQ